jgi:hypothetical protein
MPMVYRVKYDGDEERASTFFAKQGEALQFRRANKDKSPDPPEKLKIINRVELCALLNDPHGYDPNDASGEFL